MEDHDDFAFEPIPGLPERLPQGETLLWQGSPDWRALAVSAFHVRKVAIYLVLLLAWELTSAYRSAAGIPAMLSVTGWVVLLGGAAVAILCALAYFYARGTIYTLTTKRIVIRSGLALPVTLNLPLALIETAKVAKGSNGGGSIALTVTKPNRVAFLVLWPNARPWHLTNPQPALRCLDDVDIVAPLLAGALAGDAGASVTAGAKPTLRPNPAARPAQAPAGAAMPA